MPLFVRKSTSIFGNQTLVPASRNPFEPIQGIPYLKFDPHLKSWRLDGDLVWVSKGPRLDLGLDSDIFSQGWQCWLVAPLLWSRLKYPQQILNAFALVELQVRLEINV